MKTHPDDKPSWKEQQRELSARAGLCLKHDNEDRSKPGQILKFTTKVYEVLPSGALKFLCTREQWEAGRKKAEEEAAQKVLAEGPEKISTK